MKTMRILTKTVFYAFLVLSIMIFALIGYLEFSVSNEFKIKKGNDLRVNTIVPVTADYNGIKLSQSEMLRNAGDNFDVKLKAFGVIPFSTASVQVVDELEVAVLGAPFGMRIYTEGVLVINTSEVKTENGNINVAKKAGIKKGDYILSVNKKSISTNEDLSEMVESSNGEVLEFLILRDKKKITLSVKPEISNETGTYKIGIWIKDSSAGIGMLTFYSPATETVCGLGHGICDDETGALLKLNSGEMVSAEIISIEKGEVGAPGQLKGKFGFKKIGGIKLNSNGGVYAALDGDIKLSRVCEVALKQEIENGKAQILCTVDDNGPKLYDCIVEVRTASFLAKTQNMVITVTDKALLEKTGGIVQGMSGSPIIQNGKLIGAVTHVLVDDPTKGYAIFAENMLETAQSVAESNKLKDAS